MTMTEHTEILLGLRRDMARSQKKGLHFILAAVIVWALVLVIHLLPISLDTRNILTFICSAPLFLLAVGISKLLHVNFFDKSNPLSKPGIAFSMNQMLYLPLTMWAFRAHPERMLMIYAVITGAHLLPYAWLYLSDAYLRFSFLLTFAAFAVGLTCSPAVLAGTMLVLFIGFALCLRSELRREAAALES